MRASREVQWSKRTLDRVNWGPGPLRLAIAGAFIALAVLRLRRRLRQIARSTEEAAEWLGVPYEDCKRWQRAHWDKFLVHTLVSFFVYLPLFIGLVLFRDALLGPCADRLSPLAGISLLAPLLALWLGYFAGLRTAWTDRHRPALERETRMSVAEVMREFGYRPARVIGWRRIGEEKRRAATPRD